MIIDIQYTYTIVLWTYPDISESIFINRIYFIAANITVGLHVIYCIHGILVDADNTWTIGR